MDRHSGFQTKATGPASDFAVGDSAKRPESRVRSFFASVASMLARSELPQSGHRMIGGVNFPVKRPGANESYKFPGPRKQI